MGVLLTISLNAVGNDSVNVIIITSVTAGHLAIKGRVYEKYYNDILESLLILIKSMHFVSCNVLPSGRKHNS